MADDGEGEKGEAIGSEPGQGGGGSRPQLLLACLIALEIGLHNLGEGLAIGSAYAIGNLALGQLLIIGFAIHNTTEGLAIVSPVARRPIAKAHFLWMGLLAGIPTIFGAWLGDFTYSVVWSVLFLGIGAGAIAQVVYAVSQQVASQSAGESLLTPLNFGGLAAGFLIMYGTGLLTSL